MPKHKIKKALSLLKKMFQSKTFRAKVIYFLLKKYVKVKDKTILYESYHGKSMTGNPYAMYLTLSKDGRFKDYTHIWILEDIKKVKELKNTKLIKRNSLKHAHYLLTSKYLINNTTFLPYVSKRENQIYINTWHGVPLKTLGDDIRNSYGSGKNVARNLLQTDFLVLPSKYTTDKLLQSHHIETLYPGKIIENGYPRTDLLFKNESDKINLKNELNIPINKKVILYAPTYRGDFNNPLDEKNIIERLLSRLASKFDNEYIVLYKGHYFKNFALDNSNIINIPNSFDSNELLNIVDILITDYSSIAFDFLVLQKPILYYAYDLEEYTQDRGLYFNVREMPGALCEIEDNVILEVENVDTFMTRYESDYSSAIEKFCKYDDGRVTQKVVDAIFFSRTKEVNIYKIPKSQKKKILLYGGGFLNNGVTSSLVALLSNISYEKYDIYLISNSDVNGVNFLRTMERIPQDVKIIYVPESGTKLVQAFNKVLTSKQLEHIYKQENYTFFGNAKFDIAIDYSGYGSYWASMMAYASAKTKYIYLHNDMKAESQKRSHLLDLNFLYDLYKNRFDKLITVSSSSYHANKSNFPKLKNKIMVVNNPIDAKKIFHLSNEADSFSDNLQDESINFINIGRYSAEKGQDRLIEAFTELTKEQHNLHLYIVGHGPLHNKLEASIEKLGMSQKITLTGNLENPFPLLKKCDCFVLSSHYEGQGIVLLEALVLGIPCISTNIPGPQSVLADDQGLLVEDSIDGLKDGMKKFLNGEVPHQPFDHEHYTQDAMNTFYKTIV